MSSPSREPTPSDISDDTPEPNARDLWQTAFIYFFIVKFKHLFVGFVSEEEAKKPGRPKPNQNKGYQKGDWDFSPLELEKALESKEENDIVKRLFCGFAANLSPGRTVPFPWTERTLGSIRAMVNAHLNISPKETVAPEEWLEIEQDHAKRWDRDRKNKKDQEIKPLIQPQNPWDLQVDSARRSDFYMDGNPFGWDPVSKTGRVRQPNDIFGLPTWEKVQILRYLCEWQLSESAVIRNYLTKVFDEEDGGDSLLDEIGRDSQGNVYFAEGNWPRLYRENEKTFTWEAMTDTLDELKAFCETLPKLEPEPEVQDDKVYPMFKNKRSKPLPEALLRQNLEENLIPRMIAAQEERQAERERKEAEEAKKAQRAAAREEWQNLPPELRPPRKSRINYRDDVWDSDQEEEEEEIPDLEDEEYDDVEDEDFEDFVEEAPPVPKPIGIPTHSRSGRVIKRPQNLVHEESEDWEPTEPVVRSTRSKRRREEDSSDGEVKRLKEMETDDLVKSSEISEVVTESIVEPSLENVVESIVEPEKEVKVVLEEVVEPLQEPMEVVQSDPVVQMEVQQEVPTDDLVQ